jgi:hypothetical protein
MPLVFILKLVLTRKWAFLIGFLTVWHSAIGVWSFVSKNPLGLGVLEIGVDG